MSSREIHWRVGDRDVVCRIEGSKDRGVFHIAGNAIPFHVLDAAHIEIAGVRHRFYAVQNRASTMVWLNGRTYDFHRFQKTAARTTTGTGSGEVRAIMPGKLLRVAVNAGDTVTANQAVAVMESMKMESVLTAPLAGRVTEVRFKPGEVVEMGDIVVVIDATDS
jgi:biotin carboxyl carrier protein